MDRLEEDCRKGFRKKERKGEKTLVVTKRNGRTEASLFLLHLGGIEQHLQPVGHPPSTGASAPAADVRVPSAPARKRSGGFDLIQRIRSVSLR